MIRNINQSNLLKKVIIYTAVILTIVSIIRVVLFYDNLEKFINDDIKKEVLILKDYMLSMRKIYHKQFLDSKIQLNEDTLGFLPAHASTLISEEFMKKNKFNFYIKNVSDRPRNPINMADKEELKAIKYFNNNQNVEDYFVEYLSEDKNEIIQYASPIYTQGYCLSCHGKKSETIETIQNFYDTAYNYEVGDLRGIVSIKIPKDNISQQVSNFIMKEIIIVLLILMVIYFVMFYLYKKMNLQIMIHKKEMFSDSLTGVFSRKYFEQEILRKKIINEEEYSYVLVFVNIDNLKVLYESYGYSIHDSIIKYIADNIQKELGKDDILCRYSEKRFVIASKVINTEVVYHKIEYIRKMIEKDTITIDNKEIKVTISSSLKILQKTDNLSNEILKLNSILDDLEECGGNKIVKL